MYSADVFISKESLKRLKGFKQLILGFSGGLDSSVLLHLLTCVPQLRARILAVHINHGLSPNAFKWQAHCQHRCSALDIPLKVELVDFNRNANVEEAARNARFEAFSKLLTQNACLVLGHHQNDQAETLLLQLVRGTGIDGLAGMQEFSALGSGVIARPLLGFTQEQLLKYAHDHQLHWIEDESNRDLSYSRNYIRHQLMPLLLEKWPGVIGNLARTAAHCHQAKVNLYCLAMQDCAELKEASTCLSIDKIKSLPEERVINILRVWFKKNKIKQPSTAIFKRLFNELVGSDSDANPCVAWGDKVVYRYQNHLYLEFIDKRALPEELTWSNFPASCCITEDISLTATEVGKGFMPPTNSVFKIKFRTGGERLTYRGQTKKLKKLLQEWHVPDWLRDRIPLIYVDEQLAVVVGFAVSDDFYSESKGWLLSSNSEPHHSCQDAAKQNPGSTSG